MNKRIFWIDFGKGITIFLVVLAHTLANINNNFDYINSNILLPIRFSMYIIFIIIMPVFFAISGFLHKKINSKKQYINLLKKKGISLGIPYIVFSVLLVILGMLTHLKIEGVNGVNSLFFIWIKPISYLWFLYSLFLCFVIVGWAQLKRISSRTQLIIYIMSTIIFEFVPGNSFFYYISQTFSWTLCFYIGYLCKEYDYIYKKKIVLLFTVVCVCSICWQILESRTWYIQGDFFLLSNTLAKLSSILIMFYLYSHIRENNFSNYFNQCGKCSLVIYLVHVPIISILRKIFIEFGIFNPSVLVFLVFIVSWYLSIFICYIINNIKIFNLFFYPNNYIKLKK